MSTESKAPGEETLAVSNEFYGASPASPDALVVAEAIYALAREVRLVRHELWDRLGEIRDSVRT